MNNDMTKYIEIENIRTAYMEDGTGRDMLLLHGWGQNKEMMQAIYDHFKDRFHVVSIDFPGFGESNEPPEAWGVGDYEDHLYQFVHALGMKDMVIIGHSFGCRVAIRYAADHPDEVYKMCLTGAAGIRPKQSLESKVRTKIYKAGKWYLKTTGQEEKLKELQDRSGSADYRAAKGIMRPTFVKIVNEDLTPLLKDVKCSVLLVWGDQDDAAPLWMGQIMEKEMPDAGLAIFEGDDHWAYWHQANRFNQVLDIFLKGDETV